MSVSRLSQRRQVVIPRDVCEEVGLQEGDLVEVVSTKGAIVITSKKDGDPGDRLTPREAAKVLKGESQLVRGESISLDELESALKRAAHTVEISAILPRSEKTYR